MNLSKQIIHLRKEFNLSQEDLAEKVFVSRQSISNWERGKSYPDIESLLLLSNIFDVSLDHLVKGDVNMMKNEINRKELDKWTWLMLLYLLLALITVMPIVKFIGMYGVVVPFILWLLSMFYGFKIDRFKAKHNIKTFSQILDHMEGKDVKTIRERTKKVKSKDRIMAIMIPVIFAGVAFLIVYISMKIWRL
ncbi:MULTISPECIES: helix-turn-helix transcriptional regulator [Mammaliicoccus]|uniref:helix-turn-helix domain-containing protein n=1 Tax=Mammaliicoccus TaxID=2803850 RepID=UPI000D1CF207|nr:MULTISPECIES: helix-turn-helix transcriptional regulator [Mammaliicoccus]MBW0764334.1 helix-turn-helix transcriptional regulator [Mammaliicoccus fleurettii]MEB7725361.1 helix-turn-helix domain-containing protein [Mammaliicoccus fleurettii]MEB7781135.1 helix-turn-helix domain-containing protein [Mammaliicoccus fleurettii]MEB8067528.1 helix-turn-helix domain-containing protein [Mammaliicoccus fleurettii]PTE34083.1 transcriptional regulator [Mammaliicoccus fleurettii]